MINIIGHKKWYFIISFLLIIPGVVSLLLYGLSLSIDFTGGSRLELQFPNPVSEKQVGIVRETIESKNIAVAAIQRSGNSIFVRSEPINEKLNAAIVEEVADKTGQKVNQEEFITIGPTIGQETTWKAVQAVVIATALIVIYIAWSFRKVPKPTSSWRFGICTVAALLHDVLLLIGIFSILGYFFNVEIDSLFLTAVLTVIGFSVHDTIVVFDRIRENLLRMQGAPFAKIVNDSMVQTLNRSLNTSITALLVLFALFLFGGESTRWFVFALLIGIASGTYSSIFNAAPLLVVWDEWDRRRNSIK
jgi:preprotein translocase subunit SecF